MTEPTAEGHERVSLQPRSADREFDLGEFLRLIWRRKRILFLTIFCSLFLAVVGLVLTTPTYTGNADVLIDTRKPNVANIDDVLSDALPDKEGLSSEIEVMMSRGMAGKVVDKLHLMQDPEFNTDLEPPSPVAEVIGTVKEIVLTYMPSSLKEALLGQPQPEQSPEEIEAWQRERTIDNLLDAVMVAVKGESRVIRISATSEDPDEAMEIANAFADAYVVEQLDVKYEATKRANEWLSAKLDDLRRQVSESEQAVEAYRRKAGLLQASTSGTLIDQQVSDLNQNLIVARTERAAAEARLSQIRELIRSGGGAEAAADVMQSPIIQNLMSQETEVKRKVAEMAEELGERHPRMISARAELRDVQTKIEREVNKIVRSLENEVGVARAREASLQGSLSTLEGRLAQANASSVQLQALQRDADANKALLEQFLSRFEQIDAQSDQSLQETNARVLSRAVIPDEPSAPKKGQILALIFIASSIFGIFLILAVEHFDRGFRSGDQLEEMTGIRALGLVPRLKGFGKSSKAPEGIIVKTPSSLYGESIRSVFTSILISQNRAAPRTVMITSSQPREGKTTLAASLARLCAISGKSTVIVEADLRKPRLHRLFGIQQAPGLVEYFLGEADISKILYKDPSSEAFVVPSGKFTVDPSKLLASGEMKTLLATLSARFDLVIVDTPPLMAVSDARLVGPQVDATVFVVRWARTEREVVRLGLKTIIESGARVAGTVLTMVDADEHAQYGFGDSGYYYKGVKSYYTR